MKEWSHFYPLIRAVFLFAVLDVFGRCFPSVVAHGFVLPAGQLAAWIMGATPAVWDGAILSFYAQELWVQVTAYCSGYSFFCILSAWLAYRIGSARLGYGLALLPACWLIAVCINALRVAASIYTCKLGSALLPDSYQKIIHQATGVFVFLSFLIILSILLQFLQRYVPSSSSTA